MNKEKDEKIRIRFKNGDVLTMIPISIDGGVMKKFEQLTGIKFEEGDNINKRTVQTVKTWLSKRGLHHRDSNELIDLAERVIALNFDPDKETIMTFAEENHECCVYIIHDTENEIFRVSKALYAAVTNKFEPLELDEQRPEVETLSGLGQVKYIKELNAELKKAVEAEDYETAAAIRDKINAMNKS